MATTVDHLVGMMIRGRLVALICWIPLTASPAEAQPPAAPLPATVLVPSAPLVLAAPLPPAYPPPIVAAPSPSVSAAAPPATAPLSAANSPAAGQPRLGQEPGWAPQIVARGEQRARLQSTPILERPYRPLHFYGNTVRRLHYRGTPLPTPREALALPLLVTQPQQPPQP